MSATMVEPTAEAGTGGAVRTMDLMLQEIGRVRPLRPHEHVDLARRIEHGDAEARRG